MVAVDPAESNANVHFIVNVELSLHIENIIYINSVENISKELKLVS